MTAAALFGKIPNNARAALDLLVDPLDGGLVDQILGHQCARGNAAKASTSELGLRGVVHQRPGLGPAGRANSSRALSQAASADHLAGLGFDQLLHHEPDRLADQVHAITGTERLEQLGHRADWDRAIGEISFIPRRHRKLGVFQQRRG